MELIDVPNSNTYVSFYLVWSRWVGRDETTIVEVDVGSGACELVTFKSIW